MVFRRTTTFSWLFVGSCATKYFGPFLLHCLNSGVRRSHSLLGAWKKHEKKPQCSWVYRGGGGGGGGGIAGEFGYVGEESGYV